MKPQQYDFKQAAYQRAAHNDFQNVFDFPDFIEMRPVIRAAVHEVATALLTSLNYRSRSSASPLPSKSSWNGRPGSMNGRGVSTLTSNLSWPT